jgi:hypothetical protein
MVGNHNKEGNKFVILSEIIKFSISKIRIATLQTNQLCYYEDIWGSGGIAPHINFSNRWRRVVSFMSWMFTSGEIVLRTQLIEGWVGPRDSVDMVAKRKVPARN